MPTLLNGGGATLGVVHVVVTRFPGAGVGGDRPAATETETAPLLMTCPVAGFATLEPLGHCRAGLGGDCTGGRVAMAAVCAMAVTAIVIAEGGASWSRDSTLGASVRRPLYGWGDHWTGRAGGVEISKVFRALAGDPNRTGEGDTAETRLTMLTGVLGTTLTTVPCTP